MSTKNGTGPRSNAGPVFNPKKLRHNLSDIDEAERTATCSVCGPVIVVKNTAFKGKDYWLCGTRHFERTWRRQRPYLIHRKAYCERCGLIPEDICQIDVDHRNGDHSDNRIENLSSYCSNCHRVKTLLQGRREMHLWTESYRPQYKDDVRSPV